ncbi:MAG: DUF4437 domain-containing protein [Kiloniellales bacterium]|nr:DUF4437 domain-containing protein [Kiloniellales bacterium]
MSSNFFGSVVIALAVTFIGSTQAAAEGHSTTELVKRADVKFIPLNPLRGDLSPKSGKLWGNIREDVSSGMLVTFADGFQSPPHIHNITYRAVVIDGAVHNDDPTAEKMWMEPGSFWTQPVGESHITAAKGQNPTIFLEILSGPYLVKPEKEAFDAGERPINVEARNIMWLDAADTTWITGVGPKLAYLWGEITSEEKNGTFVKLPAGYSGKLSTVAPLMRVVTIRGVTQVQVSGGSDKHKLDPGSYFGSTGKASHELSCLSGDECILYLHTEGKYQLTSP